MNNTKERSLFGTDGIRGVANEYPMTSEVALSVGRALAYFFRGKKHHRKVLIGKDTRLSGYMIETAIASGVSSMGVDVLLVGPMPTPAIAFLTGGMRADGGVMISASHNPFQDNGIKLFDAEGFKLSDEAEKRLEELVFSEELTKSLASASSVGKAFRVGEAKGRYIEYLKGTFPRDFDLEGVKIVIDCAHGASYEIAPTVFEELGATVYPIGVLPNGTNINEGCGAMRPTLLQEEVKRRGADLGIALDGDGDRAVFVNEKGEVVDGDAILAICGEDLNERGLLKGSTVVATVMSNIGLEEYLGRCGVNLVRTSVGDRYIMERMRRDGYQFGGESSGHLVFRQYSTTGDGILAGLQLLALVMRREKPLSVLAGHYSAYPQVLKNVRVRKRVDLNLYPAIQGKIQEIGRALGRTGRLLVRYSGTEPLVRVMIEGRDATHIERMAQEIASCVSEQLS
ncbi:MAG: phosphoglucosamine mutase [Deltaproteobacteria bacterium]|nr:phosphoglucosamine mutase [Deltaproteobacteria bacterium]